MTTAETIRIEIPIETIDNTDPALSNATKKLAAAHSVRMDRLNELPAVEEQPEQTAFDRTCAPFEAWLGYGARR